MTVCNLCPNEAKVGTDPPLCLYCEEVLKDRDKCRSMLVGFILLNLRSLGHPNPEAFAKKIEQQLKEKENEKNPSRTRG